MNFQPDLRYSKQELKQACKDFLLVGWKRWSRKSNSLFLRWMLNEMGAVMSLIHGNTIKPVRGLGRGYRVWKETHDAECHPPA